MICSLASIAGRQVAVKLQLLSLVGPLVGVK